MTHDEAYAHLDSLSTAESWAWLYAQSPEVQELALRNMVALSAVRAGHDGDAAWTIALVRVPEERKNSPFRGVDPEREWAAALDAVSDHPVNAEGWHTNVSGEISSQGEMVACLRAGASANAHLVSYELAWSPG